MTRADALELSIAHWLANEQALSPDEISIGTHDCALCELFVLHEPPCLHCPVFKTTKQRFCYGSPYPIARDCALDWWDADGFIAEWQAREAFHFAAREERLFLESLRHG